MIPYLLAAVGGYLIGNSLKSEKFASGGRIKVGTFDEAQLKNREDKKAVEKAMKDTGLKYVDTKIVKKGGKMYMDVFLIPDEEYYKSSKFADGGTMMADGGNVWSEIRSEFEDEGVTYIDGYLTEDDDEEGKVIAKVKEDGEVEYVDNRAKKDLYAQEIIKEVVKSKKMADGGEVKRVTDGDDTYYLTYIDSTHFYLSNSKDYKGNAFHIAEFRSRPFYDEVKSWLKSHKGGMMAKGGGVSTPMSIAKAMYNKYNKNERKEFLIAAGYSDSVANDLSNENWDSLEKQVHTNLARVLHSGTRKNYGTYEKGGITRKKLLDIQREYDRNEDNNYHSENVVLLAKHFGTKEDLKEAKDILKQHEQDRQMTSENMKRRNKLDEKLQAVWKKERNKK